jgi:hypothetical protein
VKKESEAENVRLPSKQHVQERGNKEEYRKDNGAYMERFLNAAASAIHAAISAKCEPCVGTASLKKDSATKKYAENKKDNIQNHIEESVPNLRGGVKMNEF